MGNTIGTEGLEYMMRISRGGGATRHWFADGLNHRATTQLLTKSIEYKEGAIGFP